VPLGPGLRSPFCARNGKIALAWDENVRMELRGVYITASVD
jgi:hypothetical protein